MQILIFFFFLSSLFFSNLSFAQNTQNPFPFNVFFTEHHLKVSSEIDNFSEGSLRTVLLKAAALRHQNAFNLVKIEFDPQIKKIKLQKNPLPVLDFGFVSIDCGSQVSIDGSLQDKSAVFVLDSQFNQIKNCEFTHFSDPGILISGSENTLEGNRFIQSPKSIAVVIGPQASSNKINNCLFENLDEAIQVSSNSGWANEFSQNQFKQISSKEIMNRASRWDSPKINLKQISASGVEIELLGSLNEDALLELYYSSSEKQWLPLQQKKVQPSSGEFRIRFNISNIPPQSAFAILVTALRKNTSDFSNSLFLSPLKTESNPTSNPSSSIAPSTPQIPEASNHPKEELKENLSEEEQKDTTKELPKADPLFNSNKLPGFENPSAPNNEKKSEVNIQSNKKSGPSDSFKVEVLDAPSSAP